MKSWYNVVNEMSVQALQAGRPSQEVPWGAASIKWQIARAVHYFIRAGEVRSIGPVFGDLGAHRRVTRRLFGYNMHLDLARSDAQKLLYLMGERFISERGLFNQLVRPGMTVVDVGANIGYHVLLFEKLIGPQGKLVAIEPSPENLPELRANLSANDFRNVRLEEAAVGAERTRVSVRGGINSGVLTAGQGIATVPMHPLDDLVHENVDFVKIDVDGYEFDVLSGARDLLRKHRPIVLVEMHPHILPRFGSSVRAVIDLLREWYPSLQAFDQIRAGDESVFARVLRRYWDPERLDPIDDLDELARVADSDRHNWTFWIVARPA